MQKVQNALRDDVRVDIRKIPDSQAESKLTSSNLQKKGVVYYRGNSGKPILSFIASDSNDVNLQSIGALIGKEYQHRKNAQFGSGFYNMKLFGDKTVIPKKRVLKTFSTTISQRQENLSANILATVKKKMKQLQKNTESNPKKPFSAKIKAPESNLEFSRQILYKQMLYRQMLRRQMLSRQMLHKQQTLGTPQILNKPGPSVNKKSLAVKTPTVERISSRKKTKPLVLKKNKNGLVRFTPLTRVREIHKSPTKNTKSTQTKPVSTKPSKMKSTQTKPLVNNTRDGKSIVVRFNNTKHKLPLPTNFYRQNIKQQNIIINEMVFLLKQTQGKTIEIERTIKRTIERTQLA